MKRLCGVLAVAAILAGCGASEADPPVTGMAAAVACLEAGGATKIAPTEDKLQRNIAAAGPRGSAIFIGASDVDTNFLAARRLRAPEGEPEYVTWLTPDRNAFIGAEGDAPPKDWRLAMKCGLVMPDKPGKANRELRSDEQFVRTEFNSALIDSVCDLRPDRASAVMIGYAFARNIGLRRMDGFIERTTRRAVRTVLDAETGDQGCRAFREWRE